MKPFRLVLVRHGFSLGNEQSLFSGWSDVPLTEWGRAELCRLRREMDYPVTDRYFSSDLRRCKDTFHLLYGDWAELDGIRPEFREIYFGALENRPATTNDFIRFFHDWLTGKQIADGESYQAFGDRVLAAVTGLVEECHALGAESATVVTHSGFIRTAFMRLHHWPLERWPSLDVPNGLGYILELDCERTHPEICAVERMVPRGYTPLLPKSVLSR